MEMLSKLLKAAVGVALLAAGSQIAKPAAAEPFEIVHTTWVGYGPLFLARDLGYFKEEGVDVVLTTIEDHALLMTSLMSGKVAGAVSTVDEYLLYMNANNCLNYVLALDESRGGDGVIASKSIPDFKSIKGQKVAYNEGSVSQFWFSVLLKNAGLSFKDVESVNMTPDDAAAALRAGQVPVAVTWEPHITEARNSPDVHVLADSSSTPGVIVDVLGVTCDTAKKRAKDIQAINRAWNRAVDYWKQNPEEANKIMAKGVGGWLEDPAAFADALKGIRFFGKAENASYFGTPDKPGELYEVFDFAVETWNGLGKLQVTPKAKDVITGAYLQP
jgi:NitT/TauT family transport system substrate-binding protein